MFVYLCLCPCVLCSLGKLYYTHVYNDYMYVYKDFINFLVYRMCVFSFFYIHVLYRFVCISLSLFPCVHTELQKSCVKTRKGFFRLNCYIFASNLTTNNQFLELNKFLNNSRGFSIKQFFDALFLFFFFVFDR